MPAITTPETSDPPRLYCLRQKIEAYRRTFVFEDGKRAEGEQYESVKPVVDYAPATWYDDAGNVVTDPVLVARLYDAYYKSGN